MSVEVNCPLCDCERRFASLMHLANRVQHLMGAGITCPVCQQVAGFSLIDLQQHLLSHQQQQQQQQQQYQADIKQEDDQTHVDDIDELLNDFSEYIREDLDRNNLQQQQQQQQQPNLLLYSVPKEQILENVANPIAAPAKNVIKSISPVPQLKQQQLQQQPFQSLLLPVPQSNSQVVSPNNANLVQVKPKTESKSKPVSPAPPNQTKQSQQQQVRVRVRLHYVRKPCDFSHMTV